MSNTRVNCAVCGRVRPRPTFVFYLEGPLHAVCRPVWFLRKSRPRAVTSGLEYRVPSRSVRALPFSPSDAAMPSLILLKSPEGASPNKNIPLERD